MRVRDNDSDGWARFVRLYGPLVYGWARNTGLQSADAADITQDVFSVVQQKIHEYDPDRPTGGGFRSWLWGVTRLCLLQHFRSRASHINSADPEHLECPSAALDASETGPDSVGGQTVRALLISTAIRVVKSESESNTWDAFWRMAVHGHSATEIAAELGTNAKAVRQAKFRITKKLRLLLQEAVPEFNDDFKQLKDSPL